MIAFTICANNYLAKACVLLKSIKLHSNIKVYLFLADNKADGIDYNSLGFDSVIVPEQLEIENLQWQLENYNIIEFNTALKGPAFKYLFLKTSADIIYYFDPDIKVYQPLESFNNFWNGKSILLTPHILSPIPFDGLFPGENLFLNHGIYNLGFLGLKRSVMANNFLNWWSERLAEKCIIDLNEGYFTDQIWITLVPLLFNDVTILGHPGFNAAYWNLHDRYIIFKDGKAAVNDAEELYFYHFSSFDVTLQKLVPSDNARYNFNNRSEMTALYEDYLNDLKQFETANYKSFLYFDGLYPKPKGNNISLMDRIIRRIRR
ncbi:hypothetical protein GJU39_05925 [Pedobacter petrophilus]|uniref:Glycosyl transferase n=2 Tax=Pedobacter petrophilus TaxID=1908241 RepID=A0A7K0FW95_9SPHI|nr:hypothetical protein [Pedobacter petrophilus]MRX75622.1 hypothetical protein [Pedobacter petrophilus]